MDFTNIQVQFKGIRPMMFDRYAGDNNTQLPPQEMMYLVGNKLVMPAINLYSMLVAENTKSVCRQFMGKQGKTIALGISSYTRIDPFEIPIMDDAGQVAFTGFNAQIYVSHHVPRLKGGIPNPKSRPVLALPWRLDFTVEYVANKFCSLETLRQAFQISGTLGLGTFRPFFGTFTVSKWNEE